MLRSSLWRGALAAVLAGGAGLGWAYCNSTPANNSKTYVIQENNRKHRCKLVQTWRLDDGSSVQLMQDPATNEKITVVDARTPGAQAKPNASSKMLFFWGRNATKSPPGAPTPPEVTSEGLTIVSGENTRPVDNGSTLQIVQPSQASTESRPLSIPTESPRKFDPANVATVVPTVDSAPIYVPAPGAFDTVPAKTNTTPSPASTKAPTIPSPAADIVIPTPTASAPTKAVQPAVAPIPAIPAPTVSEPTLTPAPKAAEPVSAPAVSTVPPSTASGLESTSLPRITPPSMFVAPGSRTTQTSAQAPAKAPTTPTTSTDVVVQPQATPVQGDDDILLHPERYGQTSQPTPTRSKSPTTRPTAPRSLFNRTSAAESPTTTIVEAPSSTLDVRPIPSGPGAPRNPTIPLHEANLLARVAPPGPDMTRPPGSPPQAPRPNAYVHNPTPPMAMGVPPMMVPHAVQRVATPVEPWRAPLAMQAPTGYTGPTPPTPFGGTPATITPENYAQFQMAIAQQAQAAQMAYLQEAQQAQIHQLMLALRDAPLPSEREVAAQHLANLDLSSTPLAVQALIQTAKSDPAVTVREGTIRCLAQMRNPDATVTQALASLKNDADPRVRQAADQATIRLTSYATQVQQPAFPTTPRQ